MGRRSAGLPSSSRPAPHAHRAHRTHACPLPCPGPRERSRAGGEWGSVPGGRSAVGGTMWALCLCPRAKRWGPPRPASHGLRHPHLCRSPPPPRPAAPGPRCRPRLPGSLSCPHSGHRPSSSAVSGGRGGVVPREDGPRRLRAWSPQPLPAAPAPCAPLHPGPGPTCLEARLGSAAAARLLGPESRGGCAGGASPEPRPGPHRAPPVRSRRPRARGAGPSPGDGLERAPPARRSPPRASGAGRSAGRRGGRRGVTLRRRGVAGVRAGSRLGRLPGAAAKEPRTPPLGPRP